MTATHETAPHDALQPPGRSSNRVIAAVQQHRTILVRFAACMLGSVVLAAMVSPVEGSSTDFYYELRKTIRFPRLWSFLLIGVILFLLITFWFRVVPFLGRPGVFVTFAGAATAAGGYVFMHWNDNVGEGKFGEVADAVGKTKGLTWITSNYFGWLHWTLLVVVVALIAVGVAAAKLRLVGWLAAAIAVFAAYATYHAHDEVGDRAGGADHSLGYLATIIGFLLLAGAACVVAVSESQVAATRAFVNRVMGWRPGLVLAAIGAILGVLGLTTGRWYAPGNPKRNTTLDDTRHLFDGVGLDKLAYDYLSWLAWTLLIAAVVVVAVAALVQVRLLGWLAAVLGAVGCGLTVYAMYQISHLGAQKAPDDGATWQNLGNGGWMAGGAFLMIGGAGLVVALARRGGLRTPTGMPVISPSAAQSALVVALAFALFFPPTMTPFWQQVLVTEIGPYLLLAVGLNVVVGWAGLLDLGYIAFFAVGCYFTAYLTNSLPIKPPSWLVMPPLAAIPFAILACVLAGIVLGAPTLRLRGDYLAIVTLGFGEIIQLAANNADGVTNGSRGTAVDPEHHVTNVPHPYIHIGPLNINWGENQLQYWYLLLIYLVILVVLFRGLEQSRIGRAWAAIREDEVAAEASGVNTFRIKLLAFAIGASTSGVAGVFYGSQVGYFSPTDFTIIYSILVVAYVVFGGMGSLVGALAGAATLTWLPRFLQDQVPPADKQMWIGAIVVLMMIFRPAGLVPAKRRRAELGHAEGAPSAETIAVPASGSLGGAP